MAMHTLTSIHNQIPRGKFEDKYQNSPAIINTKIFFFFFVWIGNMIDISSLLE
jgi:hypothetical protein